MALEHEQIKKLILEHTARVCVSKESARASLIAEGFYTEDGELTERYGGPSHTEPQEKTL